MKDGKVARITGLACLLSSERFGCTWGRSLLVCEILGCGVVWRLSMIGVGWEETECNGFDNGCEGEWSVRGSSVIVSGSISSESLDSLLTSESIFRGSSNREGDVSLESSEASTSDLEPRPETGLEADGSEFLDILAFSFKCDVDSMTLSCFSSRSGDFATGAKTTASVIRTLIR